MTSLWVVLLAVGVSGIATAALLPALTAIPRERWAMRAMQPFVVQTVTTALGPGLVALAFRAPPPWALALTLTGGAFAIGRLGARYASMREVKRLTRRLPDETRRASAIAAIGPALDRGRPANHDPGLGAWAHAALVAAAHLIDTDEPAAARNVLERTGGIVFTGLSAANQSLIWAHVELLSNEPKKARSALDSIRAPIPLPLLAAHAEGLEALVLACEGDGLAALARVEAWKHPDAWHGKLRLTARIVAHASRGETQLRERNEHELARRFGPRALGAAQRLADASASVGDH